MLIYKLTRSINFGILFTIKFFSDNFQYIGQFLNSFIGHNKLFYGSADNPVKATGQSRFP